MQPHRFRGAPNFRDLGGLRTTDGRQVRAGRLFRSDSLADLTPDDLVLFATLGVRSIVDLRDPQERHRKPNRLPAAAAVRQHTIGFLPPGAHHLLRSLGPESTVETVHRTLIEYYKAFALTHATNYARMFDALLEADALPALIHCTSGKDRTGFGVALILSALGVPREQIVADYLRSNHAPRDIRFMLPADIPEDTANALMSVRSDYLDAAFDAIAARWTGMGKFLADALGLGHERREQLRSRLLE